MRRSSRSPTGLPRIGRPDVPLLLLLPAVALLGHGCTLDSLAGFGGRVGAFIPGAGQTKDYGSSFLWGACYGRDFPAGVLQGDWSWEAGLDFASPEVNGETVDILLVRADLSARAFEWAQQDISVYGFCGGQVSLASSGPGMALTGGVGIRSKRQHWDARFTGQAVMGNADLGSVWLLTAGVFF